jgi:hypothetical protein
MAEKVLYGLLSELGHVASLCLVFQHQHVNHRSQSCKKIVSCRNAVREMASGHEGIVCGARGARVRRIAARAYARTSA